MAVVEDVLGHPQLAADAPYAYKPTSLGGSWSTAQASAPIGFREARERLSMIHFNGDADGAIRALTSHGNEIRVNSGKRARGPSMVAPMSTRSNRTAGRTPTINVRPGRGGLQRRPREDFRAGLAQEYGEITWWPVAGGASLGVLELDPEGDTAVCLRLSSEDRSESFLGQIVPTIALAQAKELKVRRVLFAEEMSGTREVRPDRAGPPPPGTLERDDMLVLDGWIRQGWVKHVIWRDVKRIARATLPAEILFDRWERHGVGLWLVEQNDKVDYGRGRTLLTVQSAMAADDRNTLTRNMLNARIYKWPLRGKGWGGATRFGTVRDPETGDVVDDEEQFPFIHIMFELAERGDDGKPFTYRQIAARLKELGCPLNHSTVGKILRDPIYATGEWVVHIGDVPITQKPARLSNPVPLDRYQRVQAILDTREGTTRNTEVGEFLFNYVPTVHTRCAGEVDKDGKPVRIRGYVDPARPDFRTYHHKMRTPNLCKKGGQGGNGVFTWARDTLEQPVIRELRRLVAHPEVLRAHADATRHEISSQASGLSSDQRLELENELTRLEERRVHAADTWLQGELSRDASDIEASLESFRRLDSTYERRIQQITGRLRIDAVRAAQREDGPPLPDGETLDALLELMSVETPSDPLRKNLRARIFQRLISRIEIEDEGDGRIEITLYGHLVPPGEAGEYAHPLHACADLIESFRESVDEQPSSETVASSPKETTVSDALAYGVPELLDRPRLSDLQRKRQLHPTNEGWTLGRDVRGDGVPAWKTTVLVGC
jgi:hypothetical protein